MTHNQLPPLPEPDGQMTVTFGLDEKRKVPVFFGDRLTAYALAALAQQAQEPVHQFRRQLCADWYDGHPDHEDGGGTYETRILYTTPPAPQVPAPVDERSEFEKWYADHANKHNAHGLTFTVEGITELREGDHYGEHRTYLNNLWEGWQARAALQPPAPQTKG